MPGGRPTIFDEKTTKLLFKLAFYGLTDQQMCDAIGCDESTLTKHKQKDPEFFTLLKEAKQDADKRVVKSMYKKANGFSKKQVKVFQHQGKPIIVPYTEYYPPDTGAIAFWLKNRQSRDWRDRKDFDITSLGEKIENSVFVVPEFADAGISDDDENK